MVAIVRWKTSKTKNLLQLLVVVVVVVVCKILPMMVRTTTVNIHQNPFNRDRNHLVVSINR